MSLDPESANFPPRKLPDTGLQPARCFAIIDLGMQPGMFKGVPKEPQPEVMFCFELPKFMNEFEGKKSPTTIFQKYSFYNTDKAKLPKVMQSWGKLKAAPTTLNIKPYLGQSCLLNITHTQDGKYANISDGGRGINPLMDGMAKLTPINENIWFEIPKDFSKFDWTLFFKLPKFAQTTIRKCTDWNAIIAKSPEPTKTMEQNGAVNQMEVEHEGVTTSLDDEPVF